MSCEVSATSFVPGLGGCQQDSHADAIGRNAAQLAIVDPTGARSLFESTLNAATNATMRREIARGFADSLPHDLLVQVAGSTDGRALLERARTELRGDLGDHRNEWGANQLDKARQSADLRGKDEFKALDPDTRQAVLARIAFPATTPAQVDNLIALTRSPGFEQAAPATRSKLMSALADHPTDTLFCEGLQKLAGDPAFKKLTTGQQATAIAAFGKVAGGWDYQGPPSNPFGVGAGVSDADKRLILDNAQRVVTSEGFQRLGTQAQKEMIAALDGRADDPAFTRRLVKFAQDPGLAAMADKRLQARLLEAYGDYPPFARGIDTVLADSSFTALGATDRAKALTDLAKLSETKSFKEAKKEDRQAMVEIIGNLAAQSAALPANATLRNTLSQIVDDRIKLVMYQEKPTKIGDSTFHEYGSDNPERVRLNIHPETRAAAAESNRYLSTLPHEVNHHVNGDSKAGTADRFYDEYRASLVGLETSRGRPLTPAEQLRRLDNLVDGTNDGYTHLAKLYKSDDKFRAVIDGMYATLKGKTDADGKVITAPATVDAADARKRLLDAGFKTDYLNKTPNLDNH